MYNIYIYICIFSLFLYIIIKHGFRNIYIIYISFDMALPLKMTIYIFIYMFNNLYIMYMFDCKSI